MHYVTRLVNLFRTEEMPSGSWRDYPALVLFFSRYLPELRSAGLPVNVNLFQMTTYLRTTAISKPRRFSLADSVINIRSISKVSVLFHDFGLGRESW